MTSRDNTAEAFAQGLMSSIVSSIITRSKKNKPLDDEERRVLEHAINTLKDALAVHRAFADREEAGSYSFEQLSVAVFMNDVIKTGFQQFQFTPGGGVKVKEQRELQLSSGTPGAEELAEFYRSLIRVLEQILAGEFVTRRAFRRAEAFFDSVTNLALARIHVELMQRDD